MNAALEAWTTARSDPRLDMLDRRLVAEIYRRGRVGSPQRLGTACQIPQAKMPDRLARLARIGYIPTARKRER